MMDAIATLIATEAAFQLYLREDYSPRERRKRNNPYERREWFYGRKGNHKLPPCGHHLGSD